MKGYYKLMILCLWAWMPAVDAVDPIKDPRLRDEDVSATSVAVQVTRNPAGLYVYTFDVESPSSNTSRILLFTLDIACNEVVDAKGFRPGDFPSDAGRSLSEDGRHVPVAVDAPWGQAAAFRIGFNNDVRWSLAANPGTDSRGLTLISPYPPGAREYNVIPSVRYNEEQWDYSDVMEDDPEIPWIDDWTITGLTTGPACPGEEYPDHEEPSPRFLGSPFPGQPELNNALLSYSAPLRDQFHVEPGTRELEMTIHYHENIDPKTFVVTPEKNQLRRLFNPQPGGQETVRIPLEPGKNRIELQVQSRFTPPGRGTTPPRETRGREGVSLDRDVFVVRVPDDATAPGKGRGRP